MKKVLSELIGKMFSVYVGGEFERMTDFIGFMKLLTDYSDFWNYTKVEQRIFLEELSNNKYSSIDANIYVKVRGRK